MTPVLHNGMLIMSGLEQPTRAYRLRLVGGKWTPEQVWENADVSFYMSSPVLAAGRLFGLSNKRRGELVCLDASTGALLWTGGSRAADNAAILASSRTVIFLTTNSELIVAESGGSQYEGNPSLHGCRLPRMGTPRTGRRLVPHQGRRDAEPLEPGAVGLVSGLKFEPPQERRFKFQT